MKKCHKLVLTHLKMKLPTNCVQTNDLYRNIWNHLMSLGFFKNIICKIYLQIIYIWYICIKRIWPTRVDMPLNSNNDQYTNTNTHIYIDIYININVYEYSYILTHICIHMYIYGQICHTVCPCVCLWFLCLMAYQLFLGYLMPKPFS